MCVQFCSSACVLVSVFAKETAGVLAHYKLTSRRGPVQHDMLMACWETGRMQAYCSHSSHYPGIISSVCVIFSISAKVPITTSLPVCPASIKQSSQSSDNEKSSSTPTWFSMSKSSNECGPSQTLRFIILQRNK